MPPVKALGMYGEKNKRFTDVIEAYMKLARVDYKKINGKSRQTSKYILRKKGCTGEDDSF